MALVSKSYNYQKYLCCLISLACILPVLCCKNIFSELILQQQQKDKTCPVATDEIVFSDQKFENNIEPFEDDDKPKEKNVFDTLKVILKKVKHEVNSDTQGESSAKDLKYYIKVDPKSDIKHFLQNEISKSGDENLPFKLYKKSDESESKTKRNHDVFDQGDSLPKEGIHDSRSLNIDKDDTLDIFKLHKHTSKVESKGKSTNITILGSSNDNMQSQEKLKTDDLQINEHRFRDIPHKGTYTDISKLSSQPAAQNISNVDTQLKDEEKPSPPPEAELEGTEHLQPQNDSLIPEESLQTANDSRSETLNLSQPSGKEIPDVDVNTSTVLPEKEILDEARKEKDQLETYSQFAERVSAEKKNGVGNGHSGNGQTSKGSKVKSKNYASTDCGAKFIAANPEASHSHKIINSNKDEYMLNKCTEKLWVVVELCESIKPQKFDIANFELFSNLPKEIQLYGSHRYPTREWIMLGTYEGEEGNRGTQSFHIETQEFLKYIKLEIHSHYGTEFYCPLSQFRIYGMSEFEVIEEETEDTEEEPVIEEEEDVVEQNAKIDMEKDKRGIMIPDIFKSIFNGVLEVIKRGSRSGNISDESELIKYNETCKSLKEEFTIKNESCHFADSLNYILACYFDEYLRLMFNPFIFEVVNNLDFCHRLATIICSNPQNNDSYVYDSICNNSYACVMLSPKHILAMCHMSNPLLLSEFLACEEETQNSEVKNLSTARGIIGKLSIDVAVLDDNHDKITGVDGKLPSYEKNTSSYPQKVTLFSGTDGLENEPALKILDSESLPESTDSKQRGKEEIKIVHTSTTDKIENASSPTATEKPEKVEKVEKQAEGKKEKKAEKTQEKTLSGVEDQGPHMTSTTTTTPPPSTAIPSSATENRISSHSNKESVVVRLSNKIKVLEQNMSISSQYLEELSRRYKIQMEEMERQFNITIHALNRTSQTAYERDVYHQKRIEGLEEQVEKLTKSVTTLVQEKETFLRSIFEHHIILLTIQVLVIGFAFAFCMKRARTNLPPQEIQLPIPVSNRMQIQPQMKKENIAAVCESNQEERDTSGQFRRMSYESIKIENKDKPKERRFSGQTSLKGTYQDLLITESNATSTAGITKEKKKKKKKTQLQRSISNVSISESKDSSSFTSKKEKKLEKLKKSSAGVIFVGEKIDNIDKSKPNSETVGNQAVEDIQQDDWQLVKRNKSKKGKMETSSQQDEEQNYVFSSDLKRGKITVIEEPFRDVYQHPYYTEILYDDYVYGKAYIEEEYKDFADCEYEAHMVDSNGLSDTVSQVYTTPEFDYDAPVINDYYHSTRDSPSFSVVGDEMDNNQYEHTNNQDDPINLWNTGVLTKPIVKQLKNTSVPPSLKGKTRLRSDNWEWYSSQPSRLLPKSTCTEIVSNSSSDSNGLTKQQKQETKIKEKFEKKKKRKKSKLLVNGENH